MKDILLNDGDTIPAIAFGVYMIPNDGSAYNAVKEALRVGHRHIDTAAAQIKQGICTLSVFHSQAPNSCFKNNPFTFPASNTRRKDMDFSEVIKNRYSCKKFDERQVGTAQLNAVLEAGRMAPTAKNLQEQRIYVVRSEAGLAKIDKVTPCRYGAPTVIVVAFDTGNVFTYPGGKRNSGVEDASIVATHMMLAAANEGVDSCWINFFNPEDTARELGLPENEEVLMMLDLGYAAPNTTPLPTHNKRKELSETVRYL